MRKDTDSGFIQYTLQLVYITDEYLLPPDLRIPINAGLSVRNLRSNNLAQLTDASVSLPIISSEASREIWQIKENSLKFLK